MTTNAPICKIEQLKLQAEFFSKLYELITTLSNQLNEGSYKTDSYGIFNEKDKEKIRGLIGLKNELNGVCEKLINCDINKDTKNNITKLSSLHLIPADVNHLESLQKSLDDLKRFADKFCF